MECNHLVHADQNCTLQTEATWVSFGCKICTTGSNYFLSLSPTHCILTIAFFVIACTSHRVLFEQRTEICQQLPTIHMALVGHLSDM